MSEKLDWTKEKTILLIAEYRKRRGLWDMTHEDYRKKDVKRDLLKEVWHIVNQYGETPLNEVEKKFHTLRTQYHRELNRTKRSDPYNSKWFAFKHLDFLSSPKACRTPKGSGGAVVVKTTKPAAVAPTVTTNYIIRESPVSAAANSASTSQSQVTTEFVIERKPHYNSSQQARIAPKTDSENRRARDLEKLIEETTKDVDEHEDVKKSFIIKEITVPVNDHHQHGHHQQTHPHHQSVEIEHEQVLPDDSEIMETEELENSIESENEHVKYAPCSLIKMHSTQQQQQQQRRSEIEETYYEEEQTPQHTNQSGSKQRLGVFQLETTPIKMGATRCMDECSVYGEYVANEMRTISSREILQTLKHKINTALFEASMAELHK